MKRSTLSLALSAVAALYLLTGATAGRLSAQQPEPQFMQFEGSVSKVQGGTIGVKAVNGNYLVKPDAEAVDLKLSVQGTADASILRPGIDVRFYVTLDKRGVATEEISKLEIFTFNQATNRYGVEQPKEEGGQHFVAGKITKLTKARELTLAVGSGGKNVVKGKVAEDAEVDVNMAGPVVLKLLRPGDSVAIVGRGYAATANAPGQVLASSIDAKLAAPLGAETKEPGAEDGEKKPAKEPKEDEPKKPTGRKPPVKKPATDKPATDKPADPKAAEEKAAGEEGAAKKPAE